MKKDILPYTTYIDVKREEDKSFSCKCLSNASRIFNLLKSRQPVKRCYIYFSVSGFYEVFQLSHFRSYGQEYDLQKQCIEVFKKVRNIMLGRTFDLCLHGKEARQPG